MVHEFPVRLSFWWLVLLESILEQVTKFNYLGCQPSLDGEPDFDKKKQIPKNMRHYYITSKEKRYRQPNAILQSHSQTNTTVR